MATTAGDVRALLDSVSGRRRILALTHNNPDPDALASAVALAALLGSQGHVVTTAYGGVLGRAENRAMVEVLHLRFRPIAHVSLADFDAVALVDTQPAAGNHALPPSVQPQIVIDHHNPCTIGNEGYWDVRPDYGACATIVAEYLQVAGVEWDERLATALFYGIKTDTLGLSRGTHEADAAVYLLLHGFVNQALIGHIENAPLSRRYYQTLYCALSRATSYGHVVFSHLDEIHRPDMVAELADWLLRAEGIDWAVVTGVYEDALVISLRTSASAPLAREMVQEVIGPPGSAGGHARMAAGRLPLAGLDLGLERRRIEVRLRTLLGVAKRQPRLLIAEGQTSLPCVGGGAPAMESYGEPARDQERRPELAREG